MTAKRTTSLADLCAERFPEANSQAVELVTAIHAAKDSDTAECVSLCNALLNLLLAETPIVPYIAQGHPSLLPDALCASSNADTFAGAVREQMQPLLGHVLSDQLEVSYLTSFIISLTVRVADQGPDMANVALAEEEVWQQAAELAKRGDEFSGAKLINVLNMLLALAGFASNKQDARKRVAALAEAVVSVDSVCASPVGDAALLVLVVVLLANLSEEGVPECHLLQELVKRRRAAGVSESIPQRLAAELIGEGVDTSFSLRTLADAFAELAEARRDPAEHRQCLQRISDIILDPQHPPAYSAVMLTVFPTMLKQVFSTVGDVDVQLSAASCDMIASFLDSETKVADDLAAADVQWMRLQQTLVSQEVLLLGAVPALEDVIEDFNAAVVTSAVRLLHALLLYSTQTHSAAVASPCMSQLAQMLGDIAVKENAGEYIDNPENDTLLMLAIGSFRLLSLDEARVLPEKVFSDIGTIASESKGNVKVLRSALDTLTFLSRVQPMVASMTVDFDFLAEQFSMPVAPNEINAAIVTASLDIMAAVAAEVEAAITFEWIELLLAGLKCLDDWKDVAGFRRSIWGCVLATLQGSEDCREYVLDEDTQACVHVALSQCQTADDADVLLLLIEIARFVSPSSSTLIQDVAQVTSTDFAQRHEVREAVLAFFDANVDAVPPFTLVKSVLALLESVAKPSDPSPTARGDGQLFEKAVQLLVKADRRCAAELVKAASAAAEKLQQGNDAVDTTEQQQPCEAKEEASGEASQEGSNGCAPAASAEGTFSFTTSEAAARALDTSLSLANSLLQQNYTARSPETRDVLVGLLFRLLDASESYPVRSSTVTLTLLALDSAFQVEPSQAATESGRELLERGLLRQLQKRTSGGGGGFSSVDESVGAAYTLLEHVLQQLQLNGPALLANTELQDFVLHQALHDVASPQCCSFVLSLLDCDEQRQSLVQRARDEYVQCLDIIEQTMGPGPTQLQLSLYRKELE